MAILRQSVQFVVVVIVVVVIAVSRIGLSLTLAYKKYLVVHGFAITGLGRIVG